MLISVLKISIIKLCLEYTYSRPHFSRHHELDVKNKKNEIKNILTSSSAFLCDFSASDCDCDNADCNWRMTSDWRSTCQSGNTTLSVNPFHTTFFEETRKYISIFYHFSKLKGHNYEMVDERVCSFCSSFVSNDAIRSKISTCHDSWAVVACAKLWPNLNFFLCKSNTYFYSRFGLWAHEPFVKQVLVPIATLTSMTMVCFCDFNLLSSLFSLWTISSRELTWKMTEKGEININ